MAAKAGAGFICLLADADDSVIAEAVRAAHLYGVRLMADLINTPEPGSPCSTGCESMGVDFIIAHVGIDQQMMGRSSIDLLSAITEEVTVPIAVAGGLDAVTAAQAVQHGASIIIVGGAIIRSADVAASTLAIQNAIDNPSIQKVRQNLSR